MKLTCQCISGDKIIMSGCSGDRKQNCTISGTPRKVIPVLCGTSICYYCSALVRWYLYPFIHTPAGAVAGSILQKFWPAERIFNTCILFHAVSVSVHKPDLFLNNLLLGVRIFNAVITSVLCPDFFFQKFMAAVRTFNACIFHSISAPLLPDPFFKICSAPELIF